MNKFPARLTVLCVLALATPQGAGAVVWPRIRLGTPIRGFSQPVHVANAGDGSGRLFVVEQAGRIRLLKQGVPQSTPLLDISGRVTASGERGLLSV